MIVYLNGDFRCHLDDGDGQYRAWEDAGGFFEGKSRAFIEGYRVVPEGETWAREDGAEFPGLMISPAINFDILRAAQTGYEELTPRIDDASLVSSIAFVVMAQDERLDDVTIAEHATLFPLWVVSSDYTAGDIVRDDAGALYRCIQGHSSQADWQPGGSPALWKRIGDPAEEWPVWSKPLGAHDAYGVGDKVTHNEKRWVSGVDSNVWEPGVYGWEEAI